MFACRHHLWLLMLLSFSSLLAVSAAEAQTRDPYYELQCSMTGAYCDRVYDRRPRKESFDEFLARKDREDALKQQEQAERIEAERQRRAREQELRAEQKRQILANRQAEEDRQLQRIADNIAAAPAWIRKFRTDWPVPQYLIGGLLLGFAALAYVGRRESSVSPVGFVILLVLSMVSLAATGLAALADNAVAAMAKCALVPAVFLLSNVLNAARGWHYFFVSHPVKDIVAPPLRDGGLFPQARMADALRPNLEHLFKHPPAYKSRNLAEKASALREKIDADGTIADAAMRRDRARAQKIAAEEELRAALKALPWWRRFWWRLR